MAAFNKLLLWNNLLRHNALMARPSVAMDLALLRHNALMARSSPASSPAVSNAAQNMAPKLFVGGLPYYIDDNALKEAFARFGEVTEVTVRTDFESGRSRGFGFVTFANYKDAENAAAIMDGQNMFGRGIRVNFASDKKPLTDLRSCTNRQLCMKVLSGEY